MVNHGFVPRVVMKSESVGRLSGKAVVPILFCPEMIGRMLCLHFMMQTRSGQGCDLE
jgi:hypothetical protein